MVAVEQERIQRYVLLLRGINVGGKNKIVMAELREQVAQLGYTDVTTYINSGNLFFDAADSPAEVRKAFEAFFAQTYPFVQGFSLLTASDYLKEVQQLPDWWETEMARKDVLFYTGQLAVSDFAAYLASLPLVDERYHLTEQAVYWGKQNEETYLKTAYHKHLAKSPFYKQVTIRNGNTFKALGNYLKLQGE